MRKILMMLIIVLLGVLCYVVVTSGLEIGNFQISSVKDIEAQSKRLNTKIEEINTLIDVEYPKKISELKTASNNMVTAKEEYLKYTNLSSDQEILDAMQKKSYAIEFLWTKLGLHARNEGVNLTFEITSSSTGANDVNDIKFTVNGSYIAITNFVYAIENDTELNFRIENFKLLPHENEILQATFTVRNIAIEGNTLSQSTASTTRNSVNTTNDATNDTSNDTTSDKTATTSTDE